MSWLSNGIKAVTKGATDAGHFVGKVADNKYTQAAMMAALVATGVGAPAAAAIMAATKGGGALLKPGGNIGDGVSGAVKGAAMGGAAGLAGNALYNGIGTVGSGSGALGGIANTAGTLGGGLLNAGKTVSKAATSGGVPGVPALPGSSASSASDIPTWLKLLGLGGTAIAGVQGYNEAKDAAGAQKAALERNTAIAGQLQSHGTDLIAGADPIRRQAETAMGARLAAGAPPPVSLAGFADTANPFRKKFGQPAIPSPVRL